jgi:Na+-driven multidrug efflux pump
VNTEYMTILCVSWGIAWAMAIATANMIKQKRYDDACLYAWMMLFFTIVGAALTTHAIIEVTQ